MSIESITKRILKEAENYAAARKKEAEKAKSTAVKEAEDKVEGILADAKVRAEQDSKLLVARRESVAGLDARKMQLAAKQEMIDAGFARALEKLQNLDAKDYLKFIMSRLEEYKGQKGEILLNSADIKKIGESLAKELKGTDLTVSENAADIKGGFILKQGDISYNSSLEMLLEDEKEQMTAAIAAKLFGSE